MSKSQKNNKSLIAPSKTSALALALTSSFLLSACAPGSPAPLTIAERATESVGCTSFEDDFWDGLYHVTLKGERFPTEAEMRDAFDESIRKGRLKNVSVADQTRIREALTELYQTLALDSVQTLSVDPDNVDSKLETLASLEMGDRTSEAKQELQEKIRERFARIESIASEAGAPSCNGNGGANGSSGSNTGSGNGAGGESSDSSGAPVTATPGATPAAPGTAATPTPAPATTTPSAPAAKLLLDEWKKTRHPAVYGGLKGLATAYQSCDAGLVPAMTSATADVQGISITGTHSNGVGRIRVVGDLAKLLKTHYYLSNYRKPASSCFAVQSSPMIYDYGGKPYTTDATDSTINFFKNAGSGSSALGIDCSGYVYSSLAVGGLKLKKSGRLKAMGVRGVSSSMFMNPQSNGLTCLDLAKFTPSENIKPGDILASSGHVILVETVGTDPLGIAHITKASDCTTSNMSVSRFNFTILQSSPVKGGIGIDRMRAADYLSAGGSMKTAMLQHAANACLAKFNGTTITTKSSSANLIRHLGTSDCLDTAIKLEKEECVASCSATATMSDLL